MDKRKTEEKIKKIIETYEKKCPTKVAWIDIERSSPSGFIDKSGIKAKIKFFEE
jgi:hypothetical protein